MGLRSDIWVAAYLRRAATEGAFAVLRRRGAPEAGAIFVVVDRRETGLALFAPAPPDEERGGERRWFRAHSELWIDAAAIEARLQKELKIDPDLWIVELDSRDGAHWLDLASGQD
jgi:hypothetical protein